jgi:hypothetical protein
MIPPFKGSAHELARIIRNRFHFSSVSSSQSGNPSRKILLSNYTILFYMKIEKKNKMSKYENKSILMRTLLGK